MSKKSQPQTEQMVKSETLLIEPFTETIQKSGLELTKAEKYALGYAPLMREVTEQAAILKPLDKTKPEDAAKAKRVSLDLGKICSRLTDKKKADKEVLLIETRLIDGLFNVTESTARLTQKDADEIVDYLAKIERERLAALADVRRAELESFGADTSYLPLEIMCDEQYERCLESAKLAFEARRIAAEKAEQERIEAERLEAERIEKERLAEIERLENERKEAERVKAELAEREKELAKERELAAAEQKRRDAELAKEREAARIEQERIAKENEAKLAEQKRLAQIEADKQAALLAEQRKAAELERQKQQAELERQKAESEKLQKELQAKKDAEAKELEAKRLAQLAPDKEKINALYKSLKAFTIPEFASAEAKQLGADVQMRIESILTFIKTESQKLK